MWFEGRTPRGLAWRLLWLAVIPWAANRGFASAAAGEEVAREVGRIKSPRLSEISGLAASRRNPSFLWVHNDGRAEEVFAINSAGELAAIVRVSKKIDDVEDIAIGAGPRKGVDYVYVGDIGDNDLKRRNVRLVRFPELDLSKFGATATTARDVEVFQLKYPDGPHDAEALLIDPQTREVIIVSKEKERSRLFRVNLHSLREGTATPLELAGYLGVDEVSGGDISASGNLIVLRSEDRGWLWTRREGESVAAAMQRAPRIVLTRGRGQGQNGESVGFEPDGGGYYTISEGPLEAIYLFPLPRDLRQSGD
jgi:hypothetical protein